ncbi:unnamed protein product [Heligmosomoides polygyrus]|uniref:Uncharacterized protein n=1 Tax=Heligmosomoides polygyrus TaxID=6339 RepID=A0A183G744_HELPZ|nr:unnamed protein product [Heligmosomoides polygyrus]
MAPNSLSKSPIPFIKRSITTALQRAINPWKKRLQYPSVGENDDVDLSDPGPGCDVHWELVRSLLSAGAASTTYLSLEGAGGVFPPSFRLAKVLRAPCESRRALVSPRTCSSSPHSPHLGIRRRRRSESLGSRRRATHRICAAIKKQPSGTTSPSNSLVGRAVIHLAFLPTRSPIAALTLH